MAAIATVAPKLSKLIPRLATDHAGEVVATVDAIKRTLAAAGLDFHALAAAVSTTPATISEPTTWKDLAVWCRNNGQTRLSLKEFMFVSDMAHRLVCNGRPTDRQAEWLRSIYLRLRKEAD